MKKSTKIILAIAIIVLLALAFFGVYKYGMKKAEIAQMPDVTQNQNETAADKVSEMNGAQDKTSSIGSESSKSKVTSQTSSANPAPTRTSISAEDRENCMKWQMARNASGIKPALAINGLCVPEAMSEALYQEYLATRNQIATQPSQPVSQSPAPQQPAMETYTNSQFGFSFKYPAGMVCDQGAPKQEYRLDVNITNKDYLSYPIRCGNKNINGGRADSDGGSVYVYLDNGSSKVRTDFRNNATESKTKIYGNNKFYQAGITALERPTYLFVLVSGSERINLASLNF
jgi:hypothetical protein